MNKQTKERTKIMPCQNDIQENHCFCSIELSGPTDDKIKAERYRNMCES